MSTTPTAAPTAPPAPTAETFHLRRAGEDFGPFSLEELQSMAAAGQLRPDAEICRLPHGPTFPARDIPWVFSDKSWLLALVLSCLLGTFGVDRVYVGHVWLGLAKLFTVGGLGLWALVDVVLFALRAVDDAAGRPLR